MFDKTVGRLNAAELDIFIGPDYIITLPNSPLPPVEYLFERCRASQEARESMLSKGSGYLLYRIVDDSFDYCFPMLRKIGNKLERLEQEIFEGKAEEVVRDLSNSKQEIINFRKVIRPQRAVLRDLERTKQRYLAEDLEVYFDTRDHSEELDLLENYKEVGEALEDTNESALPPGQRGAARLTPSAWDPSANAFRKRVRHELNFPFEGSVARHSGDHRRGDHGGGDFPYFRAGFPSHERSAARWRTALACTETLTVLSATANATSWSLHRVHRLGRTLRTARTSSRRGRCPNAGRSGSSGLPCRVEGPSPRRTSHRNAPMLDRSIPRFRAEVRDHSVRESDNGALPTMRLARICDSMMFRHRRLDGR